MKRGKLWLAWQALKTAGLVLSYRNFWKPRVDGEGMNYKMRFALLILLTVFVDFLQILLVPGYPNRAAR